MWGTAFNTEKKPFDNVLVRQALNYATDKKAIVNAVFMGSGTVAKSPIPPNMLGFNKDLKDYGYDPEKAKALLKQAGLEKGAEVTLWSMPVQRPYNPNSRRIAEMIQADWAKVGVKAKIVSYEWGNISPACAKASMIPRCSAGCLITAIRTTSPMCYWVVTASKPDLTPRAGVIRGMMSWCKGQTDQQPGRTCEAVWSGTGDFLPAGTVDCVS